MTNLDLENPRREISDYEYHVGKGNWRAFDLPMEQVFETARQWSSELEDVRRPWLCWHVDKDWCLVQQRLVQAFGWTPVVGGDPRAGKPDLIKEAIYIDFNKAFQFQVMFPHFVIEFAFLFCDRLAFWHSDLLLREHKMQRVAELFTSLEDGSMAAVPDKGGFRGLLSFRQHRFWELLGCTTRSASESLFQTGCGWWMNFHKHPNCPNEKEFSIRSKFSWECGTGIMYWKRRYKGKVLPISSSYITEGHFTRINNDSYRTVLDSSSQRDLSIELPDNYDLKECCKLLSIEKFFA